MGGHAGRPEPDSPGAVDSFTSADGLPDDFIRSLLVDADGSLWIGTRRGLTHWTGAAGRRRKMETYTQANGLGSDLVGAMARDSNGDLWVATLARAFRVSTVARSPTTPPPTAFRATW